jgi:hypothetical protein
MKIGILREMSDVGSKRSDAPDRRASRGRAWPRGTVKAEKGEKGERIWKQGVRYRGRQKVR